MKKTKYKQLPPIKTISANILHVCTVCGGDATIAWHNRTKKDQDYFGGIIKPGERLCMGCGKKRGVFFF